MSMNSPIVVIDCPEDVLPYRETLAVPFTLANADDSETGGKSSLLDSLSDENRQLLCDTAVAVAVKDLVHEKRINNSGNYMAFCPYFLSLVTEYLRAEYGIVPCVATSVRGLIYSALRGCILPRGMAKSPGGLMGKGKKKSLATTIGKISTASPST